MSALALAVASAATAALATGFDTVLVEQPVLPVKDGASVLLVTTPGPERGELLLQLAGRGHEHETAELREELAAPRAFRVAGEKHDELQNVRLAAIRFNDPEAEVSTDLELLTIGHGQHQRFLPPPGVRAFVPSPVDPDLWLLDRAGTTVILNLAERSMRFLGDLQSWRVWRSSAAVEQSDVHRPLIWATEPLWSPDGQRVLFLSNRSTFDTEPGVASVWVHELATGAEQLVHGGDKDRPLVPKAWLSSEEILAEVFPRGRSAQPAPEVVALDLLSGKERILVEGRFLALQGETMAFYRMAASGDAELLLQDLSTGQPTLVFAESREERLFSLEMQLSAQGHLVADAFSPRGAHKLLVYDRDEGHLHRLPLPDGERLVGGAFWSGDQLVVSAERISSGHGASGSIRTYLVDTPRR